MDYLLIRGAPSSVKAERLQSDVYIITMHFACRCNTIYVNMRTHASLWFTLMQAQYTCICVLFWLSCLWHYNCACCEWLGQDPTVMSAYYTLYFWSRIHAFTGIVNLKSMALANANAPCSQLSLCPQLVSETEFCSIQNDIKMDGSLNVQNAADQFYQRSAGRDSSRSPWLIYCIQRSTDSHLASLTYVSDDTFTLRHNGRL